VRRFAAILISLFLCASRSGDRPPVPSDFLLDGLQILKNRGYDSAGVATMDGKGGPLVRLVILVQRLLVSSI
jgi:glutamine phosphoribosylpyrophosphate amidotransferase